MSQHLLGIKKNLSCWIIVTTSATDCINKKYRTRPKTIIAKHTISTRLHHSCRLSSLWVIAIYADVWFPYSIIILSVWLVHSYDIMCSWHLTYVQSYSNTGFNVSQQTCWMIKFSYTVNEFRINMIDWGMLNFIL